MIPLIFKKVLNCKKITTNLNAHVQNTSFLIYYMITYVIDVKNVERGLADPFLVRE
jgi:hypothetical protein